ncbi:myb-related transcription factor, partner of profilin-like [Nerophis ophidion]|uniref:myb-related transcription factor, partner of profilin-like n=1 Tax=Nerophis ophidion TaxID=159077 RepID=UPI002ADFC1A3|nr:myb-related transcription factor, partner of profilin-like [Nerophis ophidion]
MRSLRVLPAAVAEGLVEESGRKRKRKFEAAELAVLVEQADSYADQLQQRDLSAAGKRAIWDAICEKVNAVSRTRRSAEDVKRRLQDYRRRTREKACLNNIDANHGGGEPAEEKPPSPVEEKVHVSFLDQHIVGIGGYESLEPNITDQDSSSYDRQSPPHISNQLRSDASSSAEPRRRPADYENIDQELLEQQKKLTDGLQAIAQEVRAASSAAQALRRDTQDIAAHTRQLVNAVSGLTMAVNALATVARSFSRSGPSTEQQEDTTEGEKSRNLRKRNAPTKEFVLKKRKK